MPVAFEIVLGSDPIGFNEINTFGPVRVLPKPTVVRSVLFESNVRPPAGAPVLLDVTGRTVMQLRPGPNDIRQLAPGVYFVQDRTTTGRAVLYRVVVAR
jgi:hypothetical protein